jgi:hypothetical protein
MMALLRYSRLGQTAGQDWFSSLQASRRGGEIIVRVIRDRIKLDGTCVFYREGFVGI